MEHLTWSGTLAFGFLQLTGTAVRRFHQSITSPDPFVRPTGWTDSGKLAVSLLRLACMAAVAAVLIRGAVSVGLGFAIVFFVAGLIASVAIEAVLLFVSIRILGAPSTFLTGVLSMAGFFTVPGLGVLLWFWLEG